MQNFLCSEQKLIAFIIRLTLFILSEAYYEYKREDIVMLTDDSTDPRLMPTRENMVRCLYPSVVFYPILSFLGARNGMACARCLAP
jgi:hypothetical protein